MTIKQIFLTWYKTDPFSIEVFISGYFILPTPHSSIMFSFRKNFDQHSPLAHFSFPMDYKSHEYKICTVIAGRLKVDSVDYVSEGQWEVLYIYIYLYLYIYCKTVHVNTLVAALCTTHIHQSLSIERSALQKQS